MSQGRYALVTSARNEERFLAATIDAVLGQTIRPVEWVIVNDASTDGTERIIQAYAARHSFIKPISRCRAQADHSFRSHVANLVFGYEQLSEDFDYFGTLDADITIQPDYYERVMGEFERNERLGIAGGDVLDACQGRFVRVYPSPSHVAGGVQLFRRECYTAIGGLPLMTTGGYDTVAEVSARMLGWETRMLEQLEVHHHRPRGAGNPRPLQAQYLKGKADYNTGTHPLYELLRVYRRWPEQPLGIGAATRLLGYLVPWCVRRPRDVGEDIVRYLRKEQMARLLAVMNARGSDE